MPEAASAHALIPARKVTGTPVYDRDGARLGEIQDVMLHKATGRVAYAVLAAAPGAPERYHPLPWSLLSYDAARGGYVLPIERRRLAGAPAVADADLDGDGGWRERVHDHFGAAPYWTPEGPAKRSE